MALAKKAVVLIALGVVAAILLTFVNSPALLWLSGRTNGAVGGLYLWIICGVLWFLIFGVLVLQMINRVSREKNTTALIVALLLSVSPFSFLVFHYDNHDAFVNGFAEWAETRIEFETLSNNIPPLELVKPEAVPPWWPINAETDMQPELGVLLNPQDLPMVAHNLRANEIRRLKNGIILAWFRNQTSFTRFVLVCPEDCQPPEEMDAVVVWKKIRTGLWVGVEIGH